MIEKVADLVDALGGTVKVMSLTGVSTHSAVSNWRTANRLPARSHMAIHRACEEMGLEVSPALFEVVPLPESRGDREKVA